MPHLRHCCPIDKMDPGIKESLRVLNETSEMASQQEVSHVLERRVMVGSSFNSVWLVLGPHYFLSRWRVLWHCLCPYHYYVFSARSLAGSLVLYAAANFFCGPMSKSLGEANVSGHCLVIVSLLFTWKGATRVCTVGSGPMPMGTGGCSSIKHPTRSSLKEEGLVRLTV